MRTRAIFATVALAGWLISARTAWAGSITEVGDAGDMPATAHIGLGGGDLNTITGSLTGFSDADMYAIYITDPAAFSATTDGPGTVAFDTQLFLFDANGFGVMANDDIINGNGPYNPRSTIRAASGVPLTSSGVYYLAVSGWDHDPHSDSGAIFTDDTYYAQIVGTAGPGGNQPITGWDGDGSMNGGMGNYTITLAGASYVPEPASIFLLALGSLLVRQPRRATPRYSSNQG